MRPLRVGVVGCGMIARAYVAGALAFPTFEVVACADLDRASAEAFGEEYELEVLSLDELLAAPDLDVVLNLTPASAHAAIIRASLAAGKHVYTEKPLATSVEDARGLVAEAARLGLRLGCAPDTFLGSAYEAARAAIERGDIGRPVGATARIMTGGPDAWHPNAEAFYRAGGGPMLDVAPYYLAAVTSLLGPCGAVTGFATTLTPTRTFGVGPRAGERFSAGVPTHVASLLRLESGAIVELTVSFEARGQYDSGLLVYGTEGVLELPDANAFGGTLRLRRGREDWVGLAYVSRGAQETRGLGLHELVEALREGRPHRASGELGLHVLETASAVLRAAEEERTVEVGARPLAAAASVGLS
jgi:predicted dehydrogenase